MEFSDGNGNVTDGQPKHIMVDLPAIPRGADVLLSYSTMEGFLSYRNKESGSWYIQALVEIFSNYACVEDILSLLTLVNYKVASFSTQEGWRQVPAPQSTLRKKIVLTSRVSVIYTLASFLKTVSYNLIKVHVMT